jgi:hypothetical protein
VIQKGLGIPLGTSYFVWEQMKRFNYTKWTRAGRHLIIQWTDDRKFFFMEKDTELFYQFLCQFYADREIA